MRWDAPVMVEERKRLCAWLTSVGLDPNQIPEGAPFDWSRNKDGSWTLITEYIVMVDGVAQLEDGGWSLRRRPATARVEADDPMAPVTRAG